MRMVYCAYPIDQARLAEEFINQVEVAKDALIQSGVGILYDPGDAFTLGFDVAVGREIAHLNEVALGKATGVLAFLPRGSASIGVPQEIDRAGRAGVPVAVVSDTRSWSLSYGSWVRQFPEDEYVEAAVWLAAQAESHTIQSEHSTLQVKVLNGGQMPTKAHHDDAGWDLYTTDDVTIRPGEFRDIDCGVAVRFPRGIYGQITGRSSTLRKRGLLVNQGIIDTGYIGPLYAGVWNLGKVEVTVKRGERVAQMLLHSNWRGINVAESQDLGTTTRMTAGFGSSGR